MVAVLAVLGFGCADTDGEAVAVPWQVTAFPELPEVARDVPDARIELGNLLFFDPVLSSDEATSCSTCHSEFWGMSDGLPVAVGNGAGRQAGPGRRGPNVLRRNSPSLFNVVFRSELFWDGREDSLEDQVLAAMRADDELNREPDDAVMALAQIPRYVELFAEAFPEDPRVTVENLTAAIAALQRTFVSNRSLYDAYVGGFPTAFNDELVEAMFRFADFECNSCHAPPLFGSETTYANRNVPPMDGVVDHGREEFTERADDRGKFNTPSLRNITTTDPYFHNGAMAFIDEAVRHELEQSGMPFAEEDVRLIELFIDKALRDERSEPSRPKSVPSGLRMSIDLHTATGQGP